ncbi:MAG: hypothetical protein DRQ39_02095 [Gammaproteobacteria bacterium]|nr:MAG: hypothetical protein DRQ39_02095 [Gammaproteobacteria bacterium]RKZ96197.1 MAG: hypothetical protein DRQ40_01625 [Gammaproteobacteria bacterium]RKZ97794.1 MAG: hypothetical protein DRQ42_09290 [Gammaproteobacteria bacterium]HHA19040.1 hypothetical protein [Methylophaga sp.]
MTTRYIPPKQGWFGQVFDSLFILILVYASLMIPLFMNTTESESVEGTAIEAVVPTWESLGVNNVAQTQWEKLGYDATSAAEIINDRFDYEIDPLSLIITAAFIIGYFFFMIKISEKEYRQVISEKFDDEDIS